MDAMGYRWHWKIRIEDRKSLHERVGETNEIPFNLSDNLIELAGFKLAPKRIRPEIK